MSHDWETVRLELPSELRFLIMWDCHAATLKVARPFALLQANDLDDVHRKLIASIQPFHAVRGQIIGRAGEPCKGEVVALLRAVTRRDDCAQGSTSLPEAPSSRPRRQTASRWRCTITVQMCAFCNDGFWRLQAIAQGTASGRSAFSCLGRRCGLRRSRKGHRSAANYLLAIANRLL